MVEIVNPFNNVKKTNWAKKAHDRINSSENSQKTNETRMSSKPSNLGKPKKTLKRVAKSFKIYPGSLSREFDKRVKKMQVHFDDLNFEKDYVDSGKYIMFLMAFAEQTNLWELYTSVSESGKLELDKENLKKYLENLEELKN